MHVHNSILVTDYLTKMGIKAVAHPPYRPDLAPCDFWLFPKLRGCHYETIEEMKEVVTKVIDTLTLEDFHGAFQKLLEHCSRRRLLRRGLEFHVCTINKCAHSLETYLMILVSNSHKKTEFSSQYINLFIFAIADLYSTCLN